jgi:serine/threonine protein kinase
MELLAATRDPGQISRISTPSPFTDLPAALAAGLRDRYVLERELGRGGMATVYLALDVKHKRPIALKVLHPELAVSLGPERFEREIELAARLQHPPIPVCFESTQPSPRFGATRASSGWWPGSRLSADGIGAPRLPATITPPGIRLRRSESGSQFTRATIG